VSAHPEGLHRESSEEIEARHAPDQTSHAEQTENDFTVEEPSKQDANINSDNSDQEESTSAIFKDVWSRLGERRRTVAVGLAAALGGASIAFAALADRGVESSTTDPEPTEEEFDISTNEEGVNDHQDTSGPEVDSSRDSEIEEPSDTEVSRWAVQINMWRDEIERYTGPEIGAQGTQDFINNISNDVRSRIQNEEPIKVLSNTIYLYRTNEGSIYAIHKPFVYGFNIVDQSPEWSWQANTERFSSFGVLFNESGSIESYSLIGPPENDVRWFSQKDSQIVGVLYTNNETESIIGERILSSDSLESNFTRDDIEAQQSMPYGFTVEYESELEAWRHMKLIYPDLTPAESLAQISDIR